MLLWPFNKYPGTDYETFNWEWILKTVKEWVATMQTFKNSITDAWEAMQEDWQEFIDDTYKDQITEILEQHPEWVTTVMDGAITEPKINVSFLKEIKNPFVTPEMFGAVGDGVADDTAAIQAAFDFIDNKAASGRQTDNLVVFTGKKYRTTDTLKLWSTVKVLVLGLTEIQYDGAGTALWVVNSDQVIDDGLDKYNWAAGPYISGEGLIIRNVSGNRGQTVGLEVGPRTTNSQNAIASGMISDIRITEFDIGIKHNSRYTFMFTYENMWIYSNNLNVQMGSDDGVIDNAYEKISFVNCTISDADIAFRHKVGGMGVYLDECSLDYCNAMFVIPQFSNGTSYHVTSSHIEGIGHCFNPDTISGFSGLIDGSADRSNIVISDSRIACAYGVGIITSQNINTSCRVVFDNVIIGYAGTTISMTSPLDVYSSTIPIIVNNILSNTYQNDTPDGARNVMMRMPSVVNNLIYGAGFEHVAVGPVTVTNGSLIGPYEVGANGNISAGEIINDYTVGNCLSLTPTSQNYAFVLVTPKIPCQPGEWYAANILHKIVGGDSITFKFYDENDDEIISYNASHTMSNNTPNNWYISPYYKTVLAPAGASYFKVQFGVSANDNTSLAPVNIGSMYVVKC